MSPRSFERNFAELLRLYESFGASYKRATSKKPAASVRRRIAALAAQDSFVLGLIDRVLRSADTPQGDLEIFAAETALHLRKNNPIVFRTLIRELASRVPRRRHVAAHLLFTLAPSKAARDIIRCAANTRDPKVLASCLETSRMLAKDSVPRQRHLVEISSRALKSRNQAVKLAAYSCLAEFAPSISGDNLKRASADTDSLIRSFASDWLQTWSNRHNKKSKQ